jgi:hypothetical protein
MITIGRSLFYPSFVVLPYYFSVMYLTRVTLQLRTHKATNRYPDDRGKSQRIVSAVMLTNM